MNNKNSTHQGLKKGKSSKSTCKQQKLKEGQNLHFIKRSKSTGISSVFLHSSRCYRLKLLLATDLDECSLITGFKAQIASYKAIKQQDVLGMINMCELLNYPMDRRCCSWASKQIAQPAAAACHELDMREEREREREREAVFKVALRARGINVINITLGKLLRSICVVKNSSNLNQN
jgi:hypothetical protein